MFNRYECKTACGTKFTHNSSLEEDAKSLVNGRFSKILRHHLNVQALSYLSLGYLVSRVFP